MRTEGISGGVKAGYGPKVKNTPSGEGKSFIDVLKESIQKVNELQMEADRAIAELATGKNMDIARTMIAVEKASIAFQLMTQIRNKIVEAYQEIMRMQL
ncbi:flagellar hook-basal body complex protein FliE [Candidatus Poribacteria bacterium]|nr:MAG: flagellar hook-basal body complex protein FliE [Candidatus Poribacteria bacterium]